MKNETGMDKTLAPDCPVNIKENDGEFSHF